MLKGTVVASFNLLKHEEGEVERSRGIVKDAMVVTGVVTVQEWAKDK
jgi:hypothetical protein